MDKKRSLLNVTVSMTFRILLLVGNLLVRRYLIRYIGNEVNGLNSLYLSIIGVLSVAELGVGSAITFCMYKPIVEGDVQKVSVLHGLFRKVYLISGGVIAVAGCALMPFLPALAKGYAALGENLYLTFGLMLVSVVVTYLFSAETALFNAHRDDYIATTITSGGQMLQQMLQIVTLCLTRSFVWYLVCRIIAAGAQWIVTELAARRKYAPVLVRADTRIDEDTKHEIIKNVKAMFMHRIGGVLVNTVDSIVISAFIGVALLGKYSNYVTIVMAMTSVIVLFFSPLTSMIGHLFVQDKDAFRRYYNFFYTLNFVLGCVFFLGYYGIVDNLVTLLFAPGLELKRSVSFVITVNYFIQFMRQSTLLFRDASGTFFYDRWKPIVEGVANLVLSVVAVLLFQRLLGDEFAVVGVIVATIITNLCICHIVEPYVIYKYAFHVSVKKQYLRNYGYIGVFVALLLVLDAFMVTMESKWLELLANGCIAVGVALPAVIAVYLLDKDFSGYVNVMLKKLLTKLHKY